MNARINNFRWQIGFAFLVGVVLLFWWVSQYQLSLEPKYIIDRTVRYSFTLQNKTSQLLKNVDFWVFGPVQQTSTQLTEDIQASHPFQRQIDQYGNQILHFQFDQMAPHASRVITLTARLKMSDIPNKLPPPTGDEYLGAERFIETQDPHLNRLAENLVGENDQDTAKKILQWVNTNIRYAGYIKDDRGALYAYKSRKGDCTEYMYLYNALTRINGIPTRNIGGYIYSEDSVLKPEDFHNWSEIYINGAWHTVDPQNGVFMKDQENYIAMRVIGKSEGDAFKLSNSHRFMVGSDKITVRLD